MRDHGKGEEADYPSLRNPQTLGCEGKRERNVEVYEGEENAKGALAITTQKREVEGRRKGKKKSQILMP